MAEKPHIVPWAVLSVNHRPPHGTLRNEESRELNRNDAGDGVVAAPPPTYGLWRCSVRADPNLLHWRRVNKVDAIQNPADLTADDTQNGEERGSEREIRASVAGGDWLGANGSKRDEPPSYSNLGRSKASEGDETVTSCINDGPGSSVEAVIQGTRGEIESVVEVKGHAHQHLTDHTERSAGVQSLTRQILNASATTELTA